MKTKKLIPLLIILGMMIVIASCKKEDDADTTAPTITLIGSSTVTITLGTTYADSGATATDDIDGDISSAIVTSSTVNNAQTGTYYVTYTVTDAAGNDASISRTVKVVNSAAYIAAGYSVVDYVTGKNAGTYNYNVTVAAHSTVNNKVLIYNFGGLGSSVYVEATLSGTTLTIASQSPSMMSDPGTISGSGVCNTTALTAVAYTTNYTSSGSDTGNCSYTKL
jgi:hypothetical protein